MVRWSGDQRRGVAATQDSNVESSVRFGADVTPGYSKIWYLDQVRPFLENPDSRGPEVVARYYADVSRKADRRIWEDLGWRYGILELSFGLMDQEWVTFPAHWHRGPRRTPFPIIIEVMQGRAWILLQKADSFDRVRDVGWLQLLAGEQAILPPGHVHAIMNVSAVPLVVADGHSVETEADFEGVSRHRGAAYYGGPTGFRPNPHYRSHPPVRELSKFIMAPPEAGGRDLYSALLEIPERFRFLHPY